MEYDWAGLKIENITILELIGKGGFGFVHKALYDGSLRQDNYVNDGATSRLRRSLDQFTQQSRQESLPRYHAIKIIDRRKLDDRTAQRVWAEEKIHRQLDHAHIIQFMSSLHTASHTFFLLEYCAHPNLFKYMRSLPGRAIGDELVCACLSSQVLSALGYLHARNIIHRDLKLANLLIANIVEVDVESSSQDEQNSMVRFLTIKLCDFGLSAQLSHPEDEQFTFCGTPNYVAPEVIANGPPPAPSHSPTFAESQPSYDTRTPPNFEPQYRHTPATPTTYQSSASGYSTSADIWAAGCLLYATMTGAGPFEVSHQDDQLAKQLTLQRANVGVYDRPREWSENLKDMLDRMICKDVHKRWSATELLTHSYITDAQPFVQMYCNPTATAAAGAVSNLHVDDRRRNKELTSPQSTAALATSMYNSTAEPPHTHQLRRSSNNSTRMTVDELDGDDASSLVNQESVYSQPDEGSTVVSASLQLPLQNKSAPQGMALAAPTAFSPIKAASGRINHNMSQALPVPVGVAGRVAGGLAVGGYRIPTHLYSPKNSAQYAHGRLVQQQEEVDGEGEQDEIEPQEEEHFEEQDEVQEVPTRKNIQAATTILSRSQDYPSGLSTAVPTFNNHNASSLSTSSLANTHMQSHMHPPTLGHTQSLAVTPVSKPARLDGQSTKKQAQHNFNSHTAEPSPGEQDPCTFKPISSWVDCVRGLGPFVYVTEHDECLVVNEFGHVTFVWDMLKSQQPSRSSSSSRRRRSTNEQETDSDIKLLLQLTMFADARTQFFTQAPTPECELEIQQLLVTLEKQSVNNSNSNSSKGGRLHRLNVGDLKATRHLFLHPLRHQSTNGAGSQRIHMSQSPTKEKFKGSVSIYALKDTHTAAEAQAAASAAAAASDAHTDSDTTTTRTSSTFLMTTPPRNANRTQQQTHAPFNKLWLMMYDTYIRVCNIIMCVRRRTPATVVYCNILNSNSAAAKPTTSSSSGDAKKKEANFSRSPSRWNSNTRIATSRGTSQQQAKDKHKQAPHESEIERDPSLARCKCSVMSNDPTPDFTIMWANQARFIYSLETSKYTLYYPRPQQQQQHQEEGARQQHHSHANEEEMSSCTNPTVFAKTRNGHPLFEVQQKEQHEQQLPQQRHRQNKHQNNKRTGRGRKASSNDSSKGINNNNPDANPNLLLFEGEFNFNPHACQSNTNSCTSMIHASIPAAAGVYITLAMQAMERAFAIHAQRQLKQLCGVNDENDEEEDEEQEEFENEEDDTEMETVEDEVMESLQWADGSRRRRRKEKIMKIVNVHKPYTEFVDL